MLNESAFLSELFPESAAIDAAAPEETRIDWDAVPRRGAVYLLAGPAGGETAATGSPKPILLATVGDLRAALKRRLADTPPEVKTKRIAYGQICTRVLWRRIDSSFAAAWWYWRAARVIFPHTYAAMIPARSSWWIAMEKEGPFPRLRRTTDLRDADLLYAGPVRDKHAAGKFIENIEDIFDLCRYYSVLLKAPHGTACAYKEMGKCPAPCDGSVPIPWYREQMMRAWGFLTGESRDAWLADTRATMKTASECLEFEKANRIKQRLSRAAAILESRSAEAFAPMGALDAFSFVALQPGKGKPWIEPWLIHGGDIRPLEQFQKKELASAAERVMTNFREFSQKPLAPPLDLAQIEQIAIVSHHLFRGDQDHGIYIRASEITAQGPAAITQAASRLWARKTPAKPLTEQSSDAEPAIPAKSKNASQDAEDAPGDAGKESPA